MWSRTHFGGGSCEIIVLVIGILIGGQAGCAIDESDEIDEIARRSRRSRRSGGRQSDEIDDIIRHGAE